MSTGLTSNDVGGCCCGPTTCSVTILVMCGAVVMVGASVTITSGATTIASGTTDSTGHVTLTIPGAATYTVTITKSGYGTYSQAVALPCGPITIDMCNCCLVVSTNLTMTGPGGATVLTYHGTNGLCIDGSTCYAPYWSGAINTGLGSFGCDVDCSGSVLYDDGTGSWSRTGTTGSCSPVNLSGTAIITGNPVNFTITP